MQVDHFDGKSTARKSAKWLYQASADAHAKRVACRTTGDIAHVNMWEAIAAKYDGEIDRRERRGSK